MSYLGLVLKYNHLNKVQANYFLNKFGPWLKWEKNEEILDIGSSVGNVTLECLLPKIPNDFKKLIGVDVSSEAISVANSINKNEKVKFCELDVTTEHLPQCFENRFHHVFSFYCLHWILDKK